jgi:hypothetical protein
MHKKVVAFLMGAFLVAGACPDLARAAGEAVSTMVAVKGQTVIERNKEERPARVKDGVLLIDTVSTREAARAKMLFIDDSVLTLGEKSKVIVKEYVYSKDKGGKSVFNLLDGKMKAVVGKARFEVHTPTAVAAARGTVILIETGIRNGVPFTDVISLEGEVVVRREAGSGPQEGTSAEAVPEVVLTPGNLVSVYLGEPLPSPSAAPPPVIAGFLAATESVSFEMPVPSVAELPAPPSVDGGRASSSRGSAPPAAGASVGGPEDVTDSPFADVGVPPFNHQPVVSTTTQVGVGANFP